MARSAVLRTRTLMIAARFWRSRSDRRRSGMKKMDEVEPAVEPNRLDCENHSIRRPEIARAMTSCWISLVPSKIVWILRSTNPPRTEVARPGPGRLPTRFRWEGQRHTRLVDDRFGTCQNDERLPSRGRLDRTGKRCTGTRSAVGDRVCGGRGGRRSVPPWRCRSGEAGGSPLTHRRVCRRRS
jgi:hypothetical protein